MAESGNEMIAPIATTARRQQQRRKEEEARRDDSKKSILAPPRPCTYLLHTWCCPLFWCIHINNFYFALASSWGWNSVWSAVSSLADTVIDALDNVAVDEGEKTVIDSSLSAVLKEGQAKARADEELILAQARAEKGAKNQALVHPLRSEEETANLAVKF